MSEFHERKFGDLTVRIDRATCIASANCMRITPEVFRFDEENIVSFEEEAPAVERERLVEACRVCPVDALIVLDASGEQIVP